jgi:HK97 family phage portal protein
VGIREWWDKRTDDADTSWTAHLGADASFERWVAQQGSDFLPPDTGGWPVAEWSPALREAFMGDGEFSYAGMYRTQPSVYTVNEFLGWQISQLNIKSYDRLSDTERKHKADSPVEQTLHHPAPGLTQARLWHTTVVDIGVFGNAYWAVLPGNEDFMYDGWVVVPLPAPYVVPHGGNLLEAEEYELNMPNRKSGAKKPTFPAERVLHFRRYNPEDRRIGISPLEPLRQILLEEREASRYRRILWKRDARMGGFIRRNPGNDGIAPPMDDEARKRFRAGMEKFQRGGRNEGTWMLLEEGEIPVPLTFSPKDADYIAGRKLALEVVARAYNIPLPVLSLTDTATYASQREHHDALYRDTLPPWTRVIEDEINTKMVPLIYGTPRVTEYVEFNLAEKLNGAFEEQAEMLLRAVGGPYMTRNEARARLNLPRVDDPAADELVITNNMIGEEDQQPALPEGEPAPVVKLAPNTQQGGQTP